MAKLSVRGALSAVWKSVANVVNSIRKDFYDVPIIEDGNKRYTVVDADTVREYEPTKKFSGPSAYGKDYDLTNGQVTPTKQWVHVVHTAVAYSWELDKNSHPIGNDDTDPATVIDFGQKVAERIVADYKAHDNIMHDHVYQMAVDYLNRHTDAQPQPAQTRKAQP